MKKLLVLLMVAALTGVAGASTTVEYFFNSDGSNTGTLGVAASAALQNGATVAGGELVLDGNNDYAFANVGGSTGVIADNGPFSMSFDFTPDGTWAPEINYIIAGIRDDAESTTGTACSHLVGLWFNRMEFHLQYVNVNTGSRNRYRAQWYPAAGMAINAGTTYHFECVFGGDRIVRLLVDGTERGTAGPIPTDLSIAQPHKVYVGSDNGPGQFTDGKVDNFRIVSGVPNPATTPVIGVSPTLLNFSAIETLGNPDSQTLNISNVGIDTLNWLVSESSTWLDISPTSGQSVGESDEVMVSVDIAGLTPNTYNAEVTITDPNANNSLQAVDVTLTVDPIECGDWGHLPGDINKDCRVDPNDLKILTEEWLQSSSGSQTPSFRFAAVGDVHVYDDYLNCSYEWVFNKILEDVNSISPRPEFLVLVGDTVNGCSGTADSCPPQSGSGTWSQSNCTASNFADQYDDLIAFLDARLPADIDLLPMVGNHDTHYHSGSGEDVETGSGSTAYQTYMVPYLPENDYVVRPPGKDYFSFDYGNTHFTMMATRYGFGGSNSFAKNDVTSGTQYNWLKNDLEAAANNPAIDNTLVFGHHNLFPLLNGDDSPQNIYRTVLWQGLFETWDVDAYFHAHWHYYEDSVPDATTGLPVVADPNTGLPAICLGGGSVLENACPACNRNINHYALIDITGTTIQVSIYQVQKNLPTTLFHTFELSSGYSSPADLSGDGEINFNDFFVLTLGWLDCTQPGLVNCIQL
jgi:hypothetical protein